MVKLNLLDKSINKRLLGERDFLGIQQERKVRNLRGNILQKGGGRFCQERGRKNLTGKFGPPSKIMPKCQENSEVSPIFAYNKVKGRKKKP